VVGASKEEFDQLVLRLLPEIVNQGKGPVMCVDKAMSGQVLPDGLRFDAGT